jgi:hypothetical protein
MVEGRVGYNFEDHIVRCHMADNKDKVAMAKEQDWKIQKPS